MPPWRARPPGEQRSSVRAIRKKALDLLAQKTPEAAQTLIDLMDDEDSRVRAIAASQILDRILGRAGELPQLRDETQLMSMDHLTPDEQRQAMDAILLLKRLSQKGEEGV